MKVAVLEPAATVTEVGVVNRALLAEVWTAVALDGAELRVTVQEPDAPEPRLALQETPETVGEAGAEPVIVPPVADKETEAPEADAAKPFVIPIDVEVTPGASATFTVATTPFAIVVAFMPDRMHVVVPAPAKQVTDLPAALAIAPVATEIDTILADK